MLIVEHPSNLQLITHPTKVHTLKGWEFIPKAVRKNFLGWKGAVKTTIVYGP
jgi:hypothetical protein